MKNNSESYSIGLDIGTNSVGWCVVGENHQLIRRKGRNLWGVRLFEEGKTAQSTRLKRGQRRRYARRRERIRLLQELLSAEILERDKSFFIRLEDAFLWQEDKRERNHYTLFNDLDYTDSQYYREYPTIYHLRKYLLESTEKEDIRKIYLALHHMIKYRGNFLFEGQEFKTSKVSYDKQLEELFELLKIWTTYDLTTLERKEICDTLEKNLTRKEKQEVIMTYITKENINKKVAKELSCALLGYKADVGIILQDEQLMANRESKVSIEFSDSKYEERIPALQTQFEERYFVIEKLQEIYSKHVLNTLLGGHQYLSEAMVAKYEKHHKDLQILKRLIRTYAKDKYYFLFRSINNKDKNYVQYIEGEKSCTQEELYKTLKGIMIDFPKEEDITYCLKEMEEFRFLERLNQRENSTIPYQLNVVEMKKILENQSKFHSGLGENQDKILAILQFRIPYYVGPLNGKDRYRFAWIERTKEKIYPWNFDEVVDKDISAERFITRMTNYCTYLPDEKVIPKSSLLYSRFEVYNELKQISINGRKLPLEMQHKLIQDVFLHTKKVTEKKLVEWLKKEQFPGEPYEIKGYQKDKEFASSLGIYLEFYKILNVVDEANQSMIEEIIYWLTIFEDRVIVKAKLEQKYGSILDEYQIKKILRIRPQGWSRLSRRLLEGLLVEEQGQYRTVMDYLEQTTMNFMQIITDKKIGFCKKIDGEQNFLHSERIMIEDVQRLQGSPALKRGVWQTTKIIEEIIKIMGNHPKHIFIEVAREDQDSKRTQTRVYKLQEMYKKLAQETHEYNQRIPKELAKKEYETNLDEEKLYLYFIQNGKCMYSQEALDIDRLYNYQVDHIVPQCYIKDDSIENKVLVKSIENQRKSDTLVLEDVVRKRNIEWWSVLYKYGLIGSKKYYNLTRTGFSEEDQKGFINRQLVETRQICKHIAKLYQVYYMNTQVVLVKAQLSSDFRKKYELKKSRILNDYHHAHDAYLVSVIGQTLLVSKETNSEEWIYDKYIYRKKVVNRQNKYGHILGLFDQQIIDDDGVVVWEGAKSLQNVKKAISYKDCYITKKLEENTDQFYDETIYRKKSKEAKVPLKKHLSVEKYGGYNGVKSAYAVVAEVRIKKKLEKIVIGIPVQVAYDLKENKFTLIQYLEQQGYKVVRVLRDKLMKYQSIVIDGQMLYMTSYQEVCNAKQLLLDERSKEIIARLEQGDKKHLITKDDLAYVYEILCNKILREYQIFKSVIDKIQQVLIWEEITEENQKIVIIELVKLLKADAQNANLKKVHQKLADRMGRKSNYKISVKDTYFIDQSVTGYYERRYKL